MFVDAIGRFGIVTQKIAGGFEKVRLRELRCFAGVATQDGADDRPVFAVNVPRSKLVESRQPAITIDILVEERSVTQQTWRPAGRNKR